MIIMKGTELKDDNENVYIIEDQIGKPGGFGIVYLARRDIDDKKFAIKTIQHSFPTEEDFRSFKNEIETALQISSPHVIKYEFAHDGTLFNEFPPYIIMEYATKGNLTKYIDARRENKKIFNNEELTNIFMQLAEGMKDINRRLVHRDIKADNILITEEGLKICDFGLAKFVIDNTRAMTFKGYGTPKYIAPEAWKYEKNTIQMDIYSLGIVFYELATLSYPYDIKSSSTPDEYREAHLFSAVINPTKYNSRLPATLISIILKMLEKPLGKRYNNWDDILDAINSFNFNELSSTPIVNIVNRAVNIQIEKDIEKQKQHEINIKKKNEESDFCKTVLSQYKLNIYDLVIEFIEAFNKQYANGKMKINALPSIIFEPYFRNIIYLPNKSEISIDIQILIKSFERKVMSPLDTIHIEHFFPECNKKRIYAWGKIEAQDKRGYNILLLDNQKDNYGEWWELHNTNSGFSRTRRIEPFAFGFDELPKEINLINVMHIYNSKLEIFNTETLYEFISSCL